MALSTFQIAAIASAAIAVGGVAAVKTGVVPNPFQTAQQEETKAEPAKAPAATKAKVAKAKPAVCHECGTVESIESFTEKGQATGGGAVAGGVVGAIIGHQIGSGRGQDLATVAGAVGGAVAGHQIEKNIKKVTRYRVTLRMDDGTTQVVTLDAANNVAVGDKVKIVNGTLVRN
jgi:outer membrane lipoprotein SlyB